MQKIKSNPNTTLKESLKQQSMDPRKNTRTENYQNNQNTINGMAKSVYLSILTSNVSGLNALIKRCSIAEWIKNQDP